MRATELIAELANSIKEYGDAEVYAHHEDERTIDTVMAVDETASSPKKIVLSQW